MANNNIILGLDIGTTKICAVIADYDSAEKSFEILGIGVSESKGLKRGVVVDVDATKSCIKQAISAAQSEADVKTSEACIGIAGDHIHTLDHDATVEISYKGENGQQISRADIENVLDKTKKFNLPPEREIIHAIPKMFRVDNENPCLKPLGMSGKNLNVSALIVHALRNNLANLKHCVNATALNVRQVVLEPLASAEAVLSEEQKELGVVLIDIGGGTSDIVIYNEGALVHTGIIGFGGSIITRDIATIVQTRLADAEQVKIEKAWASAKQAEIHGVEDLVLHSISGDEEIRTDTQKISSYIQARMEEILKIAHYRISQHVNLSHLSAGIVLTGGGSQLRGLAEMAKTIFNSPVSIGLPNKLPGLEAGHYSPEYATAIGLVAWCAKNQNHDPQSGQNGGNVIGSSAKGFLEKLKNIFSTELL